MKFFTHIFFIFLFFGFASRCHSQYLHRSGQKIVDKDGNEVILRGMGLGGWMLQEPYMMEMSGIAIAQWQIKSKIRDLIGASNTVTFYNAWHANHCTKGDIDSLASWGFNSVRLPMHYNLFTLPIEQEPVPGTQTWLDEGFALTDSLVKWCAANHMYVILDLHAAPGGQGMDYAICDGNPALPSLWESDANKQKTIELWRKLATRYANEPWIGGYDILNEPNWSFTTGGNQNGCSETSNAPLRQLLIQITNTIRTVDNNHLIIIEGNCWGNNYNGILPVWDNNMALSFHKYWSTNDLGSIQGIINLRTQYNVPIWLGESGENSNSWFTDAISLVEKYKIGWAWWPLKKINSIVNPLTIKKTAEYQTLLDYWKNGGTKPSEGFAFYTLMQMATNAKINNCLYRKDVIDAMFRQISDSTSQNYVPLKIPGVIHATDYDLGRYGKAYSDKDVADYHVSSGTYTAWNQGYSYRNDGVDIETSTDSRPESNGYDVGWTEDGEWMTYTINVDSTAGYKVTIRHAGVTPAKISLFANESDLCGLLAIPTTNNNHSWVDFDVENIIFYKGTQTLKMLFNRGGCNVGFLNFILEKNTTEIPFKAVSARTDQVEGLINLSCNKRINDSTLSKEDFHCTINSQEVLISSVRKDSTNSSILVFTLEQTPVFSDTITISYTGGTLKATDGTILLPFDDLEVKNHLPVFISIPGKIEAEDFSFNQGLQLETTTDIGGGQNIGYTTAGDYLEYRVNVLKSSEYKFEARIACLNNAGKLEVQQLNSDNQVVNSCQVNVPVTGGWQTWQTISTTITLSKGFFKLRVKIIDPEFNINWYKFSEKGLGLIDPNDEELKIFPNPTKENFTLTYPLLVSRGASVYIFSITGNMLKSIELESGTTTKQISGVDLSHGMYVIKCHLGDRWTTNKLFIW